MAARTPFAASLPVSSSAVKLAGLAGSFAGSAIHPPGLIKVGGKSVGLRRRRFTARCSILSRTVARFLYSLDHGRPVSYHDLSR